jgi:hypothetical protein
MKRLTALLTAFVLAAMLLTLAVTTVTAKGGGHDFKAKLDSYQETPLTLSTTGTGKLRLSLDAAQTTLTYTLEWSGLQGGGATAAHIHLGRPGLTGGVAAWLCGGGGKPACPLATAGSVSGTIAPADVQGLAAQGLVAGDFAAFIRAIRNKATYVNIHNATYGSGEIRGAIR